MKARAWFDEVLNFGYFLKGLSILDVKLANTVKFPYCEHPKEVNTSLCEHNFPVHLYLFLRCEHPLM